jgi:tRNA threonylcarbamoyladenosine biosynthesis protein TsaB
MSDLALALDGSTYSSSIALIRGGCLVAEAQIRETPDDKQRGRGEALVPLIQEMMSDNGVRLSELASVICGAGPGSFTSLRVAASVAKGIAFASYARMYAISSLLLTAAGTAEPLVDGDYLSALPAMRGELFALPVSVRAGVPTASAPTHSIVSDAELRDLAREAGSRVIGPGQEIDAYPHARGCAALHDSIIRSGAIDLHAWEPDYGRLAEAQVKWEAAHGRPLGA